MPNDDADMIRTLLTDRVEQVLDTYAPGWIKERGAGYPVPKSKQDLGSFRVNLHGARRGSWFRFSQSLGGGSVELLSYFLTGAPDRYAEAFKEAKVFLGLATGDDQERQEALLRRQSEAAAAGVRQAQRERQEAAKRERNRDTAAAIWERCRPIEGTLAEEYLSGIRHIPAPPAGWPEEIGFHPGLLYPYDGQTYPCLVARVVDVAGLLTSIWRIFLDPLTACKANVAEPKLGLGPALGGAVRLGGKGRRIGATEGLETGLAVYAITGWRFPIWPCLSTSGMAGLELPFGIDSVSIFPDGDPLVRRMPNSDHFEPEPNPPGTRAAMALQTRAARQDVRTTINHPPTEADYCDCLLTLGLGSFLPAAAQLIS